jgi:hypothetical protein
MAVKNLFITYSGGSSVSDILTLLRDAFVGQLAFTLIEDSIGSDNFFVVKNNVPAVAKSRMVVQARYMQISGTDYVSFVVWSDWTPGSPGSGEHSVQATDFVTATTNPAMRYHLLNFAAGGAFYLDGDDTDGRWLSVHSVAGATPNPVNTYVSVCSIESPSGINLGVNYGLLVWSGGGAADNRYISPSFSVTSQWVPPVNHGGFPSNSHFTGWHIDRASYVCHGPLYITPDGFARGALAGRGSSLDTYNGTDLLFPLHIHQTTSRANLWNAQHTRPAGSAYGYRGVCRGIFGYAYAVNLGFRTPVTDPLTGQQFLIYAGRGAESGTDNMLYYGVPRG